MDQDTGEFRVVLEEGASAGKSKQKGSRSTGAVGGDSKEKQDMADAIGKAMAA